MEQGVQLFLEEILAVGQRAALLLWPEREYRSFQGSQQPWPKVALPQSTVPCTLRIIQLTPPRQSTTFLWWAKMKRKSSKASDLCFLLPPWPITSTPAFASAAISTSASSASASGTALLQNLAHRCGDRNPTR